MTEQVDVKVAAQLGEFATAMKSMEHSFDTVGAHANALVDVFKGVGEAFVAAFAIEKMTHWAEAIAESGQRIVELSHQLGMTVESVSEVVAAFGILGMDADAAGMALVRLERNMVQAQKGGQMQADAIRALGISLDDLKEMSPDEMLKKMADRFHETADGPEKTAIAIALLGRRGAEMIPFLDRGSEGLAELARIGRETGTVLTDEMAEGMEQTKLGMNTAGLAFKGVSITLFEALKPAIDQVVKLTIQLVEGFNSAIKEGGSFHNILTGLVVVFNALVTALVFVRSMFVVAWEGIKTFIVGVVGALAMLNEARARLLQGDWKGAMAAVGGGFEKLSEDFADSGGRIRDEIEQTMAGLGKMWSGHGETFVGGSHKGGAKIEPVDTAASAAALDHEIKLAELLVAKKKALLDQEVALHKMTAEARAKIEEGLDKELEAKVVALMQKKADLYSGDKKRQKEELDKIAEYHAQASTKQIRDVTAAIKAEEEARQRLVTLQAKAIDDRVALAHDGQKIESEYLQELVNDNRMSAVQRLEIEREVENSTYAFALSQLQAKKALYVGESEFMKRSRQDALDAIDKLGAAHTLALGKNSKEQAKVFSEAWQPAITQISGMFDQMLIGILRGTQTWQQAMNKLLIDVAVTWVSQVAKMMIAWVAFQAGIGKNPFGAGGMSLGGIALGGFGVDVAKLGSGGAAAAGGGALSNALKENTAETAANSGGLIDSARQMVASIAETLGLTTATTTAAAATATDTATKVAATAAEEATMAGLIASIVALTVAVNLNTLVQAGSSLIPLQTGAWNIPRMMPALLHPGEMVVPQAGADAIRGGGFGGGGSPITFNIHALDGASVMNVLKQQSETLHQIFARGVRDNSPGVRSGMKRLS